MRKYGFIGAVMGILLLGVPTIISDGNAMVASEK